MKLTIGDIFYTFVWWKTHSPYLVYMHTHGIQKHVYFSRYRRRFYIFIGPTFLFLFINEYVCNVNPINYVILSLLPFGQVIISHMYGLNFWENGKKAKSQSIYLICTVADPGFKKRLSQTKLLTYPIIFWSSV